MCTDWWQCENLLNLSTIPKFLILGLVTYNYKISCKTYYLLCIYWLWNGARKIDYSSYGISHKSGLSIRLNPGCFSARWYSHQTNLVTLKLFNFSKKGSVIRSSAIAGLEIARGSAYLWCADRLTLSLSTRAVHSSQTVILLNVINFILTAHKKTYFCCFTETFFGPKSWREAQIA